MSEICGIASEFWGTIAKLLAAVSAEECINYFEHAGDAFDMSGIYSSILLRSC